MNFNPEMYAHMVHWVGEREAIRIAKEELCLPQADWTDDPVLATYRFCNVDREDDRETRWIKEHIRDTHDGSDTMWFNLVIARFINWSPTLHKLGYMHHWNEEYFIDTLSELKASGVKWGTSAYIVSTNGISKDKIVYIAQNVLTPLWSNRKLAPKTIADQTCSAWGLWFLGQNGLKNFMANQVITDMKYTHHLRNAPDWETFVYPGPGTMRGLNRLTGRDLKKKISVAQGSAELQFLRSELSRDIPDLIPKFRDLNNLSNCCCEFDKYVRVLNGEGRPRQRYKGQPA